MSIDRIDTVTGEVVEGITEAEARRLTTEAQSEFRSAVSHHDHGWQIVATAIKANGHEALGYRSASDYLEHEFAEVLAGLDVAGRRVAVRELSALGMSTRAIAPVVGTDYSTVSRDRQVLRDATPAQESRGGGAPSCAQSGSPDVEPQESGVAAPPAPRSAQIIGRDGKNYTRPEPKENKKENAVTVAPSRLAMPQPPKYGGNRPKHNKVIANAVIAAQGLCIALDEIHAIDDSVTPEEADRMAADLSNVLRSLKRIQSLLKKES